MPAQDSQPTAGLSDPAVSNLNSRLADVRQTAQILGVSESWVRRHAAELPRVTVGRLIRFDSQLLSEKFKSTMPHGNSLKPERNNMHSRYQRGSVIARGKKGHKVWYGKFREDISTLAGMTRKQRFIRLGTIAQLPTKNSARNKLAELLGESTSTVLDITFGELATRWETAEGPTMKSTTLMHYKNALRASVLPHFGHQKIVSINREGIQRFLADKAKSYSTNTLRSMRVVLGLTLGWAEACRWIDRNPCTKIKLPRQTGGRRVRRTFLSAEQVVQISSKLKEPYATLVLFLYATGLRVGEAAGTKWTDFTGNVLTVSRRIYSGEIDTVKSAKSLRKLPVAFGLLERLEEIGKGHEWLFHTKEGTPINPGNALKRYVRPATSCLGIAIGGWHDFRHTLSTKLRRDGVHPKVISDILGHSRVNLAMDVYDRTDVNDFVQPLAVIAADLVANGIKSEATA